MKKFVLTLIAFVFASSAFAQGAKQFEGDMNAAKTKAAKEKKLILIDFFSHG